MKSFEVFKWWKPKIGPGKKRLEDTTWEQYKPVILREYEHGLAHVKRFMWEHYKFRRKDHQWNYRLYKKWEVKKSQQFAPSQTQSPSAQRPHSHTHPTQAPSLQSTFTQPSASTTSASHAYPTQALPIQRQYGPLSTANAGSVQGYQTSISTAPLYRQMIAEDEHEEQEGQGDESAQSRLVVIDAPPLSSEDQDYVSRVIRSSRSAPRQPLDAVSHYARSITVTSQSSLSASRFDLNPSAASSLYNPVGHKRIASISTQSSLPSSKRSKLPELQWSPTSYDSDDPHEPPTPYELAHDPLATLNIGTKQPGDDILTSGIRSLDDHQSQNVQMDPSSPSGQKEIIFRFSGKIYQETTFVWTRNVNPGILPISWTGKERVEDIVNLSWADLHRFLNAAQMFTACRMYVPAFEIHYQIYTKIRDCENTTPCPWGDTPSLLLKQALACSRSALTRSHRQTCQSMLDEQLQRSSHGSTTMTKLCLRIAFADVYEKDNKPTEAQAHREEAWRMLPNQNTLRYTCIGNAAPDLEASFTIIRAYAEQAAMASHSQDSSMSARDRRKDEMSSGMNAETQTWIRLSQAQNHGLFKILRWCRNQLSSISDEDIAILRNSFGQEPRSDHAIKQLAVACIFGLFLMRRYDFAAQTRPGPANAMFGHTSHLLPQGLDSMTVSSEADVLWVMAAVIVETMEIPTRKLYMTKTYFVKALELANQLIEKGRTPQLTELIFVVMKSELSLTERNKQRARQRHDGPADDPWFGAAAKLVITIARHCVGVLLVDPEPSSEDHQQHYFSPLDATSTSFTSMSMNGATSSGYSDVLSTAQAYIDTTATDAITADEIEILSPRSSMQKIKEIVKQRLSGCSTISERMKKRFSGASDISEQMRKRFSGSSTTDEPTTRSRWF